jgi:hypothetical protein
MTKKWVFSAALVMAAALVLVGLASCSKKDGGTASSSSATKISGEAFNLDLPLTYNLPAMALDELGLPRLSSVKSLFDEANFLNVTNDKGFYTVVCESKRAKNGIFTGVLLCSASANGKNPRLRMTISLRPDSDGEFLYITEISIKNLESGEVNSVSYDGTPASAAGVAGFFWSLLNSFYDKDKLFAR